MDMTFLRIIKKIVFKGDLRFFSINFRSFTRARRIPSYLPRARRYPRRGNLRNTAAASAPTATFSGRLVATVAWAGGEHRAARMRSSYGFLAAPRAGSRDAERPNAGRCCTRSRCRRRTRV